MGRFTKSEDNVAVSVATSDFSANGFHGKDGVNVAIRQMTSEDLGYIMEIEQIAYEFPWTPGIFRDCLRVNYSCWVAEINNRISAYGIVMLSAGEAHILNLCVTPEHQRQGIGLTMLNKLIDVATETKVDLVLLEVRVSNHNAIKLYLKNGFNELGIRSSYYPAKEGREDAIILARALV